MSARLGCGPGCARVSFGCLLMLLPLPAVLVAVVVGRKRRSR